MGDRVAVTLRLLGLALLSLAAAGARAQDTSTCLECHALPDQELVLPGGDRHSVSLDEAAWKASAHGAGGLECVSCHTEHADYPHAEVTEAGLRRYQLERSAVCEGCHEEQAKKFKDGVHRAVWQSGNEKAAICTDCHDPHAGRRLTDEKTGKLLPAARVEVPRTCARCHAETFAQYRASAHGAALVGEGNVDVPTCIDCHDVHSTPDPRTARFRVNSPQICARCHTDAAKMKRYGLSTAVLKTYVADFHGSTVTLFQKGHPDQDTNKPVCFDCHGVHDIPHTDDPRKGLHVRENLLRTCRRCHPSAGVTFPDAWMSHFAPDRLRAPLVYWVNAFYRVAIPGTVGGMLAFVVADYARRRRDGRRSAPPPKPPAPPEGGTGEASA